jgi:2-isopropylmalate synthase
MAELTRVSHALAEIANIAPDTHQAYVGGSAFAHKAGLHASAIKVDPDLYNHADPATVGNSMRVLVTEMAGRASVELKGRELGLDLAGHGHAVSTVTSRVKELEARGWSFEAADASFELLMRAEVDAVPPGPPFALESYRVVVDHSADGEVVAEATVKVHVDGQRVISTAEGNGPVNALDAALRAALRPHLPWLDTVELADYKVRIIPAASGGHGGRHSGGHSDAHGTDAVTRVLISSSDGRDEWTTVGVHGNVVEASWLALVDAWAYAALRAAREWQRAPERPLPLTTCPQAG